MLCRCNLIVLGFCAYAKLPQLNVYILHEASDSLADLSKIVILKLLTLRRHRAKKCTSSKNQILSLQVLFLVYDEVLLLRPYGCGNLF